MPHYTFTNINAAFRGMIEEITTSNKSLQNQFSRTPSRNGDVIRWRRPVIIEYTNPTERVLFNQARDANPYFHLYESLWMLAGRNDLAPLQYYVSDFGNYSDDGETLNGAYGYRWRHAEVDDQNNGACTKEVDQLQILVNHLKHNPTSRRAVLHMSNVEDDTLKMDTTKDQSCNLSVVFEIEGGGIEDIVGKLNMTVFNRSNDMIYGALGANVCHFSVLMEYMAACIGVEVGTYCQVSSNMHVYLEKTKWKPDKWLEDRTPDYYSDAADMDGAAGEIVPLVKDPEVFDDEVVRFVEWQHVQGNQEGCKPILGDWNEPFIQHVALPMMTAFYMHKNRDYEAALEWVNLVKSADWRLAGRSWIDKRRQMWETRHGKRTRQTRRHSQYC